jgi:protein phosphatase 2C-like protein
MPVRVRVWSRHAPKRGNSPQEYEDAFWPSRAAERRGRIVRCAVADGATEASFSGRWAEMLTRAYARGELADEQLTETLGRLQSLWSKEISGKSLPWYAEEKVRQGAFSSLLGLTLGEDGWSALAIGDSCLFQVRDDELVTAFPLMHSSQFGSTPLLLSSNPHRNTRLADHLACAGGGALIGDRFLLMTDAVACWFLASAESGERPWRTVPSSRSFAPWLERLRTDRAIRNDDTTIVSAEILPL